MAIVSDSEMGGDARIEGHRIAVYHIVQYDERGYDANEIAEDFSLEVAEVREALEYADEHPDEISEALRAAEP